MKKFILILCMLISCIACTRKNIENALVENWNSKELTVVRHKVKILDKITVRQVKKQLYPFLNDVGLSFCLKEPDKNEFIRLKEAYIKSAPQYRSYLNEESYTDRADSLLNNWQTVTNRNIDYLKIMWEFQSTINGTKRLAERIKNSPIFYYHDTPKENVAFNLERLSHLLERLENKRNHEIEFYNVKFDGIFRYSQDMFNWGNDLRVQYYFLINSNYEICYHDPNKVKNTPPNIFHYIFI